jgi:hypothetical protein
MIPAFRMPQPSFSSAKKLNGNAINIKQPFSMAVIPKKR